MKVVIRQEKTDDFEAIFDLIEKAFASEQLSDSTEQYLVQHLRNSNTFIPELSIVAEFGNEIIGQILLTKIKIKNDQNEFKSLALAPVSVLPKFQKKRNWRFVS